MKIFLSAGEASGDLHAGALIGQLRKLQPDTEFAFLGGDMMAEAAGCAPIIHYKDMAFMGYTQVIKNLGKIFHNMKAAKKAIAEFRPDALVLVDYPGFNLKLAAFAHGLGIPVYYYISPKVWAWKEWRVKDIKKYCTKVLSILPFEVDFFRRHGMEVEYVGNPSVEEVDRKEAELQPLAAFVEQWRLPADRPLLALVPGSRRSEIAKNLPIMEEVACRFPQFQPVVAGAPAIERSFYRDFTTLPLVDDATFELVRNSSCALVTSGTATLETALLGTPQVVCYRGNGTKLTYNIMRRLLKIPFVSLPNLIADSAIVPEMLLYRCTPDTVAAELEKILPGTPGRDEMLRGYARMRGRLGNSNAPARAAEVILTHTFVK